jgi:hypothetical protein
MDFLGQVMAVVLVERELDAPFHTGVAIQDEFVIFGTSYVNLTLLDLCT